MIARKPCKTCRYFEAGDEDDPATCTWGDTMFTPVWFRGYADVGGLDEIHEDTVSYCDAHDEAEPT